MFNKELLNSQKTNKLINKIITVSYTDKLILRYSEDNRTFKPCNIDNIDHREITDNKLRIVSNGYIAVLWLAGAKLIYYTDNGIDWYNAELPECNIWYGHLVYSNGKFIVLNGGPSVLTSINGKDWVIEDNLYYLIGEVSYNNVILQTSQCNYNDIINSGYNDLFVHVEQNGSIVYGFDFISTFNNGFLIPDISIDQLMDIKVIPIGAYNSGLFHVYLTFWEDLVERDGAVHRSIINANSKQVLSQKYIHSGSDNDSFQVCYNVDSGDIASIYTDNYNAKFYINDELKFDISADNVHGNEYGCGLQYKNNEYIINVSTGNMDNVIIVYNPKTDTTYKEILRVENEYIAYISNTIFLI